jgi:hypothetical protein
VVFDVVGSEYDGSDGDDNGSDVSLLFNDDCVELLLQDTNDGDGSDSS